MMWMAWLLAGAVAGWFLRPARDAYRRHRIISAARARDEAHRQRYRRSQS